MTSKSTNINRQQPQQPASRIVTQRTISSSGGSSSSLVSSSNSGTGINQYVITSPSNKQDSNNKRLDNIVDHREAQIQARQREANEAKARKLQMYDNMAKSGHAGDTKALDINTYRGKSSGTLLLSGQAIQKTDYVEETIRDRVRRSEEQKKRLLAAFDYAAKTQPAGTVRDVDFASFKNVDVSAFEAEKPSGTATFQMSNGVPKVAKPSSSTPSTPIIQLDKAPNFSQAEPHVDAYERSLRQRKQECDDRKARTLAAYDAIARCGVAGPKIVVREELEQMDLPAEQPAKPKFSCTSSFSGGYARI